MFIEKKDVKDRINAMKISSHGTLTEVIQGLAESMLGTVLVTDPYTERFIGIITDGDIRRALLMGLDIKTPLNKFSIERGVTASIGMTSEEISNLFSTAVRVIPILDDNEKVVDLAVFDKRIYLPIAEPYFSGNELQYITECVLSGWVSSNGKFVERFEKSFSEFCRSKHAVSTSNGTAALHLALLACDIGPGDEVIVPSLTFIATANAVTYTGARPVFVDSEPETWNMDPDCFEKAITAETKAVIPVHLYGQPAKMNRIMAIAKQNDLTVIEDAAEAHGAMYMGEKAGSIGDLGVFSFFGNKTVTTGEGGMVVTNNSDLAAKIRVLRDHGMDKKRHYWHPCLGYNYRMTNLQAAIGVAQMENIESILSQKLLIAQTYKNLLQNINGLTLPNEAEWAKNIYWLYSILIDKKEYGMSRNDIILKLQEQNIETRPFFVPIHTQPIYATGQKLPIAERLSSEGICLPSSVNLTVCDIERVANVFEDLDRKQFQK